MGGAPVDRSAALEGFRYAWPFPKHVSALYRAKSYAMMCFVKSVSGLMFIGGANKLVVKNKDTFIKALEDTSRPLITVANHRCNIDDPLVWSMLSWREFLRNIGRQRFTLAAHNICFSKQWHTDIFSLGRCVPCVRGEGVYQQGMNFSVDMLNENQWVHIFPEGKVTPDPIRIKWGVGRLIADSVRPPIVLPLWINGMDQVWPKTAPYYPSFGKTVSVVFGDPIDTAVLRERADELTENETQKRKLLADTIQDALYSLGEKSGGLARGTALKIAARSRTDMYTMWGDKKEGSKKEEVAEESGDKQVQQYA